MPYSTLITFLTTSISGVAAQCSFELKFSVSNPSTKFVKSRSLRFRRQRCSSFQRLVFHNQCHPHQRQCVTEKIDWENCERCKRKTLRVWGQGVSSPYAVGDNAKHIVHRYLSCHLLTSGERNGASRQFYERKEWRANQEFWALREVARYVFDSTMVVMHTQRSLLYTMQPRNKYNHKQQRGLQVAKLGLLSTNEMSKSALLTNVAC